MTQRFRLQQPLSWLALLLLVNSLFWLYYHFSDRDQILQTPNNVHPHGPDIAGELPQVSPDPSQAHHEHPIERLMRQADERFASLIAGKTLGLNAAAAEYRKVRGRHPPPGWDKYVAWCERNQVWMIESFYDQLYTDLEPLWSVEPLTLRKMSSYWRNLVTVRNGTVDHGYTLAGKVWMTAYADFIKKLPLANLPDVDLLFNAEDNPRVYPSWDATQGALQTAKDARLPLDQLHINDNSVLTSSPIPFQVPEESEIRPFNWAEFSLDTPIWTLGREACNPKSAGARAELDTAYDSPAYKWLSNASSAPHMDSGYVADWSLSKSTCDNPHLRNLHASWVAGALNSQEREGRDTAILREFVPILSGSKISGVNADILCPPAMQLDTAGEASSIYTLDPEKTRPWAEKQEKAFWVGSALGGRGNLTNWTRFQRHRFVAAANASQVRAHMLFHGDLPEHVPGGDQNLPHNFALPDSAYHLESLDSADEMYRWLSNLTDVGFSYLMCHMDSPHCDHIEAAGYSVKEHTPFEANWNYRYLPDIDGNSYSGRFRAFLLSSSLPIKATIFDEWHDSRLLPWRHFVPMDNTFVDFYGILQYFAGSNQRSSLTAHDEEASKIARQGSEWSKTTSRTEDQLAYFYRIILELARIYDDRRLHMGWAGDGG